MPTPTPTMPTPMNVQIPTLTPTTPHWREEAAQAGTQITQSKLKWHLVSPQATTRAPRNDRLTPTPPLPLPDFQIQLPPLPRTCGQDEIPSNGRRA
jgi:hypothetical protein